MYSQMVYYSRCCSVSQSSIEIPYQSHYELLRSLLAEIGSVMEFIANIHKKI